MDAAYLYLIYYYQQAPVSCIYVLFSIEHT